MPEPGPCAVTVHRARADVDIEGLAGESVAVLGYGNLGRTAALNLRDSGVKVRIGNREDAYADQARADGFDVVALGMAATDDVIFVLLPDEVIPDVFAADIAPRMAGTIARDRYLAGDGFWACIGVEADRSGRARERMLALASALGALRSGAIETTAATEATLDLFVEQTVGPLIGAAIMTAFDVGHTAGIPREALVMEMYMSGEMEAVFEGFRKTGFFRASEDHGPTALFGGIIRTLDLDRDELASRFRRVLGDIVSGGFARQFEQEARNGYPMLGLARALMNGGSPITDAETAVRQAAGIPPPPRG